MLATHQQVEYGEEMTEVAEGGEQGQPPQQHGDEAGEEPRLAVGLLGERMRDWLRIETFRLYKVTLKV